MYAWMDAWMHGWSMYMDVYGCMYVNVRSLKLQEQLSKSKDHKAASLASSCR